MGKVSGKKKNTLKRDKVLKHANKELPSFPKFIAGIESFSGDWNFEKAAHLLRRTTIGPTLEEINKSVEEGLEKTLEKLLDNSEKIFEPPINYSDGKDEEVQLGETWVNAEKYRESGDGVRKFSYAGWRVNLILDKKNPISIRENMVLFWQNHFATEWLVVRDSRYIYWMHEKFRNNFIGNFKDLVKKVNIDPQMLEYLSGIYNVKEAPNENYARELLELFTVGKGPIDGDDSYTYYTESDIVEASKVLTGWQVEKNFIGANRQYFTSDRHDNSTKTFSSKFGGKSIINNEDKEHEDLIDMIFENNRASEYICEKIYRWFVYYVLDDEVKEIIIGPLAKTLRENNFEIKPVLNQLFNSSHFFEQHTQGAVIKGPIDFSFGLLRQIPFTNYDDISYFHKYKFWWERHRESDVLGQSILDSPNVAGWPAYYQSPLYHELWITSVTLPMRTKHIKKYFSNGGAYRASGENGEFIIKSEPLEILNSIDKPSDIILIIDTLCKWLFPLYSEISDSRKSDLINIVIGNNPNLWEDEYNDYINDPNDEKEESLNKKLRSLLQEICLTPEYYLS